MADKTLFFIRHYNDLDHFTPIISALDDEGLDASVVLCPGMDAPGDYRIEYLRGQPHVTMSRLVDYLGPEALASWRRARARHRFLTRYVPLRAAEKHKDQMWFVIFDKHFDKDVCRRVMDAAFQGGTGVVVFDWLHRGMNDYLGLAGHFRELCDERNLPMVSLPHGDSPHASRMLRLNEIDYSMADIYDTVSMFDAVVAPNTLCAERYVPHARKLEVLGSPRFNRAWLQTLSTLAPPFQWGAPEGLKVVFFLRNVGYPLFWDEVARTIRMVRKLPGAQLVVKHHTRDWKFHRMARLYPDLAEREEPGLLVTCDPSIHSCSLVEWADVVLDVGTSMAFQAVMQGKPVFSMEYLHPALATVSKYLPETMTLCRDQLHDGLVRCMEHGPAGYYGHETLDNFIVEIVEKGGPDVLRRYAKYLKNIQQGARQ